jgi:hypothetical protein
VPFMPSTSLSWRRTCSLLSKQLPMNISVNHVLWWLTWHLYCFTLSWQMYPRWTWLNLINI